MSLAAPSVTATPLRRVTLANGLTVFVQEMRTAPLVSVWCWYKVGSKDERRGQTGIAHFVEHMNFKGTTNIPRDQVKGIIEQFGGSWNGYTWIDETTYLETASRDALDRMLFIESERMANGLFHPDDVESERTVIISELQGGENDPEQLLDIEVTAAAFKAHGYHHPTIGWLSDLEAMTRDDLYEFYRSWYVPNNAALVIVGDLDADDALRRAERAFGGMADRPLPKRVRTVEPPQTGERRVRVERPGTTAYLKLAWHAPAVGDPDFFPMLVLDAALTGAKGLNLWSSFRNPPQRSTRLYRALVERGLAASVFGALLPTAEPFLYTVSCTAADGASPEALEAAAHEAIEAVRAEGLTRAEFDRAQHQLKARLVFESDSVTSIAHQIGYFHTIADVGIYTSLAQRLAAVTPEDVARVARSRLAPARRTVGWFIPESGGAVS
ncbi:MAG TPA: pitrilysin family protein [Vicinamibacterales bacterium]